MIILWIHQALHSQQEALFISALFTDYPIVDLMVSVFFPLRLCNSPILKTPSTGIPMSSQTTYLIFESTLLMLFVTCRFCARASTNVKKAITGSFLRITHFCAACTQTWCWESQPYVGNIPAGNLYTSAAILYTGVFPAKA